VHAAEVARFRSKIVAGPGADYGSFQSIADVLRQIGHDERVHKRTPRGDQATALQIARRTFPQPRSANHRSAAAVSR